MSTLDHRFGPILRKMQESAHKAERDAAEAHLAEFARRAGLTLAQAIAQHEKPALKPEPVDIFAGFDDWMEEKEPGYKAQKGAQKAEQERQRIARRDDAVARYGSEEAVLAPCDRELLLRKAVKAWRKPCPRPHQRWTQSVDGYSHFVDKLPQRVTDAISNAYPLPATFAEAQEEHAYWTKRRQEIEDVLVHFGDDGLDLLAQIRSTLVRDLLEIDLPLDDLGNIVARLRLAQASEIHEPKMIRAVYRDLKAYAEDRHHG